MAAFELTPEQRAAVEEPARTLQIVACAGAGKTEVLARRVVRILLEGAPADSVVAFTFTEKAGSELKERIEDRAAQADARFDPQRGGLPPVARGMYVGTIHAYCLRLLQRHDESIGVYDVLDEPTYWAWLWRFRKRIGLTRDQWEDGAEFGSDAELLRAFARSAAATDQELIPPEELERHAPAFAAALRRYRELLDEMRLLTFDGIIRRAVEDLGPGGPLARALAGRVGHVLVDEFQDLNPAQIELVRRLTRLGASLTVVGDDDQAIYQWRGGDARYFIEFDRYFPEAVRRHLTGNRRSVAPIVRAGNLVAERIEPRAEKSMETAREDAGAVVQLVAAADAAGEAEAIASLLSGARERGLEWGEMAVLLRSVRRGAHELCAAFVRRGIPYHIVGTANLLARPEIKSLARILVWWSGLPHWRPEPFGPREDVTDGLILDEVARLAGLDGAEAASRVESLRALGRQARESRRLDLVALFYELVRRVGLVRPEGEPDPGLKNALGSFASLLASVSHAYLRAAPRREEPQPPAAAEGPARPAIELAQEGGETPGRVVLFAPGERLLLALRSFLEHYGVEGGAPGLEEPIEATPAVHVMTVHQAKGLEFPMVVVANLVEGRFPVLGREDRWLLPRELFRAERYEGGEMDERRLFYVAVTRARDQLALTTFLQDGRGRRAPSKFLRDLRPLEEEGKLVVRPAPEPSRVFLAVRRRAEPPLVTLSFSDLWDYAECGYRFDLRRRGFRAAVDPALGYGKLAHHVLAWIGRTAAAGRRPEIADVERRLGAQFYLPFAGGESRETLRRSLARMLAAYLERYAADFDRIVETERRFEVPLAGARLVGRVDFLLRSPDGRGVEIVEFKVQRRAEIAEREHHQVRLYAAAARREGLNPVRGTIYNLAGPRPRRIAVDLDRPPPEAFLEQVRQHVQGIRERSFPPRPQAARCRTCDFRRICPHASA